VENLRRALDWCEGRSGKKKRLESAEKGHVFRGRGGKASRRRSSSDLFAGKVKSEGVGKAKKNLAQKEKRSEI